MPVAELFLGAFLQVLLQKLADAAVMAIARRERIDSHFQKLMLSFRYIMAVLEDAEDKQLTENSVKIWLEGLRDLAYDLDDLLDEIITRVLIQNSRGIKQYKTSFVTKLIPMCNRFKPTTLVSNYRLMSRIKDVTNRMNYVTKGRIDLNLRENVGGTSSRSGVARLPTTCLVTESDVYGRDEDKESIKEMLLRDEAGHEKFTVIPIVGMGGIGKTTLAQLVYNDKNIKQNFHVRSWVCVSEEFDVLAITKTIFESIVTDRSSQVKDLNMLQVNLQEKLSKSKFLIVLDDVWNESHEKWELLCRPFHSGLPGSRIIITTRNDSVTLVVGSPRSAFHMKLLTDDQCLSLLAQHAQKSLDEKSEFGDIGRALVKKCKGLPLAAKTLGCLLRSKQSKSEWKDVLDSKIWDLPGESNILPVLRLSYHHLPSHLKHPFAYCSVFPKDYEFDKDELVYLWMGEGFLENDKDRRKEDLGLEYFNELLSRSFFQRLSGIDSSFVMHDLINDLAHFVSAGTCYRLDEKLDTNQEYRLPEKSRHAAFLRHEYEVFSKFEGFQQIQGLRSFLPMPVQNSSVWPPFYLSNRILVELVPRLHSLRVLSLSGYSITELPSAICNLLHLRYLNLSGTSIVALPDSICDLFNLQTLSLRNCRFIRKLPSAIGNLVNLRHLDISNTDQLRDMPVEIGNLKSLQTLSKIVLRKDGGLGLKDLRDLKLLRGTLAVLELQNVTNLDDAKDASLRGKSDLDHLILTWGSEADNSSSRTSEDLIDLLQPHENLKKLTVEFYRGAQFPTWIGDPSFSELTSISFSSCDRCTSLPPLGQLPELKHLRIGCMPNVKRIGPEFYGTGAAVPFRKLETLRFDRMTRLEKWISFGDDDDEKVGIEFPLLQQLTMFKCDKLNTVSPLSFPVLRDLDLEECSMAVLKSFRDLNSLNFLKVVSITGLYHLPMELVQSLASLEVLECCNCNEMVSVWPNEIVPEVLVKLRRLVVVDCPQLVSLGKGDKQLPCNLEVLELFLCSNLKSLSSDLNNLGSLRDLIIKNCPKFARFPEDGIPANLKRLEILSCNALESLPMNISDLERLEIKECPSLKTWKTYHFPIILKKLSIKNCTSLEPVTDIMFPQDRAMSLEDLSLCNWLNFSNLLQRLLNFSNLVELYLSSCSGLRHFPEQGLPPNLRSLSIEDCASLKSLPVKIRNMTSLLSLEIRSCPRLDNFPSCDFPPNLSTLRIWDSKKFKPLSEWGLHRLASLREFSICGGFREVDRLGDDCIFPPSLIKFSIARFPKLGSLSKVLENLESLRHLFIMNCGELNVLPGEEVLGKLWHLEISECPLLSKRCLKDRGDYWPKISWVPCVKIDGTYVYSQSSI